MAHRDSNLQFLRDKGFRVASSLPTSRDDGPPTLRPADEICGRALALKAVCFWVMADPGIVASSQITERVAADGLNRLLTDSDQEILGLSRAEAHQRYSQTIGWRLENIWPLAWILGFQQHPTLQGMITDATLDSVFAYLPKRLEGVDHARVRSIEEVDALEDLFYCAHNAVRSAQLGDDTVPVGFDPVSDGGVVHERRHALTWSLSPGTSWDDTDVST